MNPRNPMKIDTLDAISPIDGRYRKTTAPLASIFSERGLIARRVEVECQYLNFISGRGGFSQLRIFGTRERELLGRLPQRAARQARLVKAYETEGRLGTKATNHDVNAMVSWMKEVLGNTTLKDILGWIHFLLTSEDVNNIAYALQLREALEKVIIPALEEVLQGLCSGAQKYSGIVISARTHGQPASPTTLGKEFAVFAARLLRELKKLKATKIQIGRAHV